MPTIQTSQDVLMYALSATIIVVGFWLSILLYYAAMTAKDARYITKDARKRVEAFWEVIELAREKLAIGGAIFKIAATGIKELAEHLKEYSKQTGKTKKK